MGMLSIYNNLQAPDLGAKLRIKGEVHDSILMWVRNEHLDEMLPKIKQCMEQPEWLAQFGIELPVPIVADIEVGTWGAGKTWKGQKYNA
jgi:DNA polymerase I-like protein with 3'-5' exonuclease and polymerase domains